MFDNWVFIQRLYALSIGGNEAICNANVIV